jgi:probable phosphoglycerate mutase
VFFVRHGLTPTTGQVLPGRTPGLHLSDRGQAQAKALSERLAVWAGSPSAGSNRGGRVAAIYTSPLERARETASPLADRLGLPAKVERGLLECDFGDWTGAKLSDLRKDPRWKLVQRHPSGFRFPGGESFMAMQARMFGAVASLCERHPGAAVVAVSHADPIKAAVAGALGTHLDLFQRIVISPCSISAVSYSGDGPVVLAVNSTSALGDLS